MSKRNDVIVFLLSKGITATQAQVLIDRADKKSYEEIAKSRFVAASCIRTHAWVARNKLGLKTTKEAVAYVKNLLTENLGNTLPSGA